MSYTCSQEQHDKCENSALCHLCDGVRLYKNTQEEKQRKRQESDRRKEEEKSALLRIHKEERKEGMSFEKEVTKRWNAAYQTPKKEPDLFKQSNKKVKIQKPRIGFSEDKIDENTNIDKTMNAYITSPVHLSKFSKHSNQTAPKQDAKRQANSGALWYAKGDILTESYLMECKERGTINARGEKTISIPKEWLLKQEKEAFQENRSQWLLPFRYKNDESIYVVKPFEQEIEMYQEIRRLREENDNLKSMEDTSVMKA